MDLLEDPVENQTPGRLIFGVCCESGWSKMVLLVDALE